MQLHARFFPVFPKRLVGLFLAAYLYPLAAQQTVGRGGPTPDPVATGTATLVSHLSPSQMLRVVLGLKTQNVAGQQQLLKDLQTKSSPQFHKWLTAAEWNAQFAPPAQDEQAVVDWAISNGLTVTQRYSNRLIVDLEGTASVIEKAFGVTLNNYQFAGRSFFSNDRDPALPANIAPLVQSVQGLNSYRVFHPLRANAQLRDFPIFTAGPVRGASLAGNHDGDAKKRPASLHGKGAAAKPFITNGSYDPTDIYSSEAYDANALYALGHCCNPFHNPGDTPPETSIAIATAGAQDANDFTGFHNQYPYLADHWNMIGIDGQAVPCTNPGCDLEGTMDFEWATAMSNSFGSFADTGHVWMYDGANTLLSTFTDIYNSILNDGHARIVSSSWGCAEIDCADAGTMITQDNIFAAMVAQGYSIFIASGDNGATTGCSTHDAVSFPASDPNVVASGGTNLLLDLSGNYISETGWQGGASAGSCAGNNGGSGGGCSVFFGNPSYQGNNVCGGFRSVPDIALNATGDFQNIFYDGSLFGEGGTSIVAPELAGYMAQVNAYGLFLGNICGLGLGNQPCAPHGNPNFAIYDSGVYATEPHYPFYDILSGCNSNDITASFPFPPFFCAGAGYDLVTGWGSFNMLQMAWAFNWWSVAEAGNPFVTFVGPAVSHWYNTDQTVNFTVTDTGSGGFPASGVAGYSDAWDVDPGNPTSELTPGCCNPFYDGPAVANGTSGSLDFVGSGLGQGCHTVNVEAWDNMGLPSGDATYGPLCYDTIAPATTASSAPLANAAGWNNTSVTETLSASDPGSGTGTGSGVLNTHYSIDNAACTSAALGSCVTYAGPFSITTEGKHTVYYFSEDIATNFEARNSRAVNIDKTAPHTTDTLSGTLSGSIYTSAVKNTLAATDNLSGVSTTVYQIDGGAVTTYTVPFSVSTLGAHTVTFHSTDVAGNVEATESATFTIHSTTTTTLTSSANPSVVNTSVTFTATVTAALGGPATGSVTFKNGATTLATVNLSSGKATFATSTLTLGSHSITATYNPTANFIASASSILTQLVEASTTTTLTSTLNPSTYGQSVTLKATVTSTTPGTITGTVTFKDGATTLGTGTVAGGVASFTTSTLTAATHSITAAYGGNGTYLPSTSVALSQKVNKASSTTTLTSSLNPAPLGSNVTFTAKVTPQFTGKPTGTVTFKDSATTLATVTLSSGSAAFTTKTLTHGTHKITATYNGDSNFNTSVSATLTETIN